MRDPLLRSLVAATVVVAAATVIPSLPQRPAVTMTPVDAAAKASASPPGLALVGAAKASIEPRPEDYGGTWERDPARCKRLDPGVVSDIAEHSDEHADHLATAGSPWPENPNCIYMGGFGIGPMNPVSRWDDEYGLWVRSVAIGEAPNTLVLTSIDGEGWFWDYATKCGDCGAKQIAAELGDELGIEPSGIVIAATHAHSAPDFIGGWGFVPDWYMRQVSDTVRGTIRRAVRRQTPARLEIGEELARAHNSERRDTYRSAEEQQLTWLRAYVPKDPGGGDRRTVATVAAYAAHPTTKGTNDGVAHADWPGVFAKRVEERFGGVAALFMTGLGNMSASGGTASGNRLADLVPSVGAGTPLADTAVRTRRVTWTQPATNIPLTSLGAAGFFDREFVASPSSVRTGKSPDTAPCASSSPYSVEVAVGAARVGDGFALTTAPGEIFSNVSNTVKEKSGATVTMPLGQANDALGYVPQQFEMSPVGQQGLGFVAGGVLVVNYEDAYSIDRCFGDATLEETIRLLQGTPADGA